MTSVVWKPNGEKCPHTNVVNGNGFRGWYRDDGSKGGRITYKDGKKDGLSTSWYENGTKKNNGFPIRQKRLKTLQRGSRQTVPSHDPKPHADLDSPAAFPIDELGGGPTEKSRLSGSHSTCMLSHGGDIDEYQCSFECSFSRRLGVGMDIKVIGVPMKSEAGVVIEALCLLRLSAILAMVGRGGLEPPTSCV
jgi:hypothetical protein